ncbi:MAG: TIGR03089 family protein [Propionicimonas sp.]
MQSTTLAAILAARVRSQGGRPLLTYYDLDTGERTELSAISFANWVDKTSNLLTTVGVAAGLVAAPLSVTHPGHWVALIWPLAAWQHGCSYAALAPPLPSDAELAVVGPSQVSALIPEATIACSLHPLGLGLAAVPPGVLDYAEVRAEADTHWEAGTATSDLAWRDAEADLTHADILGLPPVTGRVLVRPGRPWRTFADAIARPLLGGGSSVVVCGAASPDALARIAASERVTTDASVPL